MSDIPKKNDDSERASDIDLSIDLNPDMYSEENPLHASREKQYVYRAAEEFRAAEDATAQADSYASQEDGSKGFVTAKSDGAMAGVFDWVKCIVFAIAIVVVCLTFVFRLVDVEHVKSAEIPFYFAFSHGMVGLHSAGRKIVLAALLYSFPCEYISFGVELLIIVFVSIPDRLVQMYFTCLVKHICFLH